MAKHRKDPVRHRRPVVPDRIDLRDRPYLPAVAAAPPPRLNSLKRVRLAVLDQRDTNACTGFALANLVNYLLRRTERESHPKVSPFMLYSMARRYDEFPGATADAGSSVRGAMKGWYRHGVCSRSLWDRLEMPDPGPDPERDWWQDAVRHPLGAYYRVDARSITDMHVALHEVGALYTSALCHAGWDKGLDLAPQQRAGWCIPYRKALPDEGGHAFVIVGYDQKGFLILNSWGVSWGDKGLATLTYEDWLDHAMDCWVAQLGVVTAQHLEIAKASSLREGATGRVSLATEGVLRDREISPFIVDMENNGRLSGSGTFRTQVSDLYALVTRHLDEARTRWRVRRQPIDVAIYAHGGLTSEEAAADTAARWIPALYDAKIFPIFLMWETGLWSTLKNRLADFVHKEPRPTGGFRDSLLRLWDRRLERTLAPTGSMIWGEMKQNARAISADPESGALRLYGLSRQVEGFGPGRVRLHLIGHSAGAIVHSYIVKALADEGWRFETVNFMAPAVTVETFKRTVVPHLKRGSVRQYNQFHLTDEAERKDPTCRPILGYGRSLLYLVSESFEHGVRTPVLGMEKYFKEHVARLGGTRITAWAAPTGATQSTSHGDFDNDRRTMESILDLIKGRTPRGVRQGGSRRRA